jgi:hypothetical protein
MIDRAAGCLKPDGDTREQRVRGIVIATVLLAIALRIAAIFVLRSYEVPHSTYEHGEIAENLLAGRGFSVKFLGADGPTSQQAPVYPFCLAGAYLVGGVGTPRAILILSIAQAILGGILVLGTIDLARRVVPGRPMVWGASGLIVALHPTLIYAATHVQVALLSATLLTWVLALGVRTGTSGRNRDAAITGVLLALLILTDPILGLAFAGVVAAIWSASKGELEPTKRAAWLSLLVLVTAGAGIAPWIVRNYRVHGEFVAVKSTFGYAFWQGNSRLSQGTDKVVRPSVERVLNDGEANDGLAGLNRTLWKARHKAGYLDDIALSRDDYRILGAVSEPERSRILFRRALDDLRQRPTRYLELCARRLWAFVFFDETNPKSRNVIYRVGHLGLTCLAAIGILIAGASVRRSLMPTFLTAGLIAAFHALTIVSARFHVPIEPLLAVWGAAGLSGLGGLRAPAGSAVVARKFVRLGIKRRLRVGIGPQA